MSRFIRNYSLLILIVGFTLSSCTDEKEKTEVEVVDMNTVPSIDLHLDYDYPKDWKIVEKSTEVGDKITYFGNECENRIEGFITMECRQISDSAYRVKEPTFIDGFTQAYGQDPNTKISQITIDGRKALEIETSTEYENQTTGRIVNIVLANSREYWFEVNAYDADFDKAKEHFSVLIKSLKFKK